MCGLGTWELLIVLAIVVLLFGAARLPQLGKALGETVRNFKKGQSGPAPVQEAKGKEDKQASTKAKETGQLEAARPAAKVDEEVEEAELEEAKKDETEKPG